MAEDARAASRSNLASTIPKGFFFFSIPSPLPVTAHGNLNQSSVYWVEVRVKIPRKLGRDGATVRYETLQRRLAAISSRALCSKTGKQMQRKS